MNNQSQPELKPCPFCGGKSALVGTALEHEFYVICQNQKCKVYVYTERLTKKKAIKAWNTRTQTQTGETKDV